MKIGTATHLREKFRGVEAFASWLNLCPDNRISGGRILKAGRRKVSNRLANILRLAANALGRADGPMGDYGRRFKGRLGKAEGIVAGAHKLARIIQETVEELGPAAREQFGAYGKGERRAYPLRSVRSKQRGQTPQIALALRIEPLSELRGVARQSQTPAGMLPPRALHNSKIGSNATCPSSSTVSWPMIVSSKPYDEKKLLKPAPPAPRAASNTCKTMPKH